MYFPRLYPDELLYSAIARCRVHLGVDSHKSLLRELFGDTRVAAITDLPSHLESLASNIGLDAGDLAVNHTLFPLYSPFIPQLGHSSVVSNTSTYLSPMRSNVRCCIV